MEVILLSIYGICMLFIFCYSMIQLHLVYHYIKSDKNTSIIEEDKDVPFVTVQLPIYNERYVVERLINAVAALDYPKDKFEIQVLDDSTDETLNITKNKVAQTKKKGINIHHVTRVNREGYKAGALQEGMKTAKGKLIAIFDADFIPPKDFLRKTTPYFKNEEIGVVQTRWGHVNKNYSLLTKLQAFGLDAHFSIEQSGRNKAGYFINFNGTAGIWRRDTIVDAGGWQADTLTEDLDLSYRAQLKGWKFKYLEEVVSPAELPADINALKSQQFRWTKGAAENAKKNLWHVLKSNLPLSTKIHAIFHLMNSTVFICIVTIASLSIPLLFIKHYSPIYSDLFNYASLFLFSLLSLGIFYWFSTKKEYDKKWEMLGNFLFKFPLFLAISMGLSLHNAIAVIEGYLGKKTPFIRTPKFNIITANDSIKGNKYSSKNITPLTLVEGLLMLYFLFGIGSAFYLKEFGLLPFHILLFLGFGIVFYYSIRHATIK